MNKFIAIGLVVICLPLTLFFLNRIINIPSEELFITIAGALLGIYFMLYLYFKSKLKPKEQ